jgi:hypothetical protein
MLGKCAIAATVGSVLLVAAISSLALAEGFGGHGRGHHNQMFLLAHAAGLSHSEIRTAFKNDTNLKTDRTNLKNAHEALMECLVSGKDCSSQVTALSSAVQAMTQEHMTLWANLFKSAPNPSAAANLYGQLKQLQAQRKQIFQSAFGSQGQTESNGPEE